MRNRAQAAPDAVRNPSLRNEPRLGTVQAIRQIVARHGIRGLYTGFGLHALRDSIGTGLYFSIYETVKQVVVRQLGESQSPFGPPAIAGAICSTLPWFCVCTTIFQLYIKHLKLTHSRPIPSIPAKPAPKASSLVRHRRSPQPPRQWPGPACIKDFLLLSFAPESTT